MPRFAPNSRNKPRTFVNKNMNRRVTTKLPQILKTALDGRALTPKADPPTIVQQPWNTVTLTFDAAFAGGSRTITLTTADIILALVQVYPSEASSPYQIQIKSARVWDVSGNALSVAFHSLDKSNPGFLKNMDDNPARDHWARLGYIWPRSHQNQILLSDDTTILTVGGTTGSTIVLHIDILWKPIISLLPPSLTTSAFAFRMPSGNMTISDLPDVVSSDLITD